MVLVAFMTSSIAYAGLFSSSLSDADAAAVHKITVMTVLGETLYVDRLGLTVFGNEAFHVAVPEWGIDNLLTDHIVQAIQHGGRFSAEALNLAALPVDVKASDSAYDLSKHRRLAILNQAKAQGADTVLLFLRERNVHDRNMPPGFGIYSQKLLKHEEAYLFASFGVHLFRVDGDSALAQQHPDPAFQPGYKQPLKSAWDQYSAEEKSALELTLKQAIILRADSVLDSMRLSTRSALGE
jgi:hypothetical protein